VHCQLYSGRRLGKCKPGIVPDGEGLVKSAGEGIEVRGVGFCGGGGVGSGMGNGASVVDLGDEAFWKEAVRFRKSGSSNVREGGGYSLSKGMGCGVGSGSDESS